MVFMERQTRKRKILNLNILKNDEASAAKKLEKKKRKLEHKKEILKTSHPDGKDQVDDEVIVEDVLDGEELQKEDPFVLHVRNDLSPQLLSLLSEKPANYEKSNCNWPKLGKMIIYKPACSQEVKTENKLALEENEFTSPQPLPNLSKDEFDLNKLFIKPQTIRNLNQACEKETSGLTDLQKELLTLFATYHDVYYPEENLENLEEIRLAYCIHAINHVLKSRLKIIYHNSKMSKRPDVPEEFRDQGLVRPKVLILLPFRDSALKVLKMLIQTLLGETGNVMNRKRFLEEYSDNAADVPDKHPKPIDYQLLFSGNTDDNFKIGITVTKKCLKLYSNFYESDIIIASPLGLRILIGAEGEKDRDYDFLSSIELLIMDQSQVFFMQNWEHLLHLLDHLHLQPKESHGTDLARVRMWALNGWSKYYMQSIIFSSNPLPVINALYNIRCNNYNGKIAVSNPVLSGSISQVALSVPQIFHYVKSRTVTESVDDRFEAFISDILPQFKDASMKHTLIYIPSYFDFVRLRNHFKRQEMKFVHICEYTEKKKIIRARSMFFHGKTQFMLYTERYHFYRRIKLRGIRHLIFYQPPSFPSFYSEMCNFLQDIKKGNEEGETELTINVIYTKFDISQVAGIVGTERATRMVASDKPVHMLMTDS
ncbi:digestive organ expansion factor homolog [Cimex lectularius]|uniref:Digestive organ expansion factor homolog n=1 Tax=Cimex lectularius TaxID=79782 RepID=A0A8I6SDH3_CIMLE|nr:digestive organ expansion factor homolog [Cimex lectularius]